MANNPRVAEGVLTNMGVLMLYISRKMFVGGLSWQTDPKGLKEYLLL